MNDYSLYLNRLYGPDSRKMEFGNEFSGGFQQWQEKARPALRAKLGLEKIAESATDHKPEVKLESAQDRGDYWIQRAGIETEPEVQIPFWLLKPKSDGPWPVGIFPHGHDCRGHDTSAGEYHDKQHREKSLKEDRDVAVQAVKRGFLAIAPAVRGLSEYVFPGRREQSHRRLGKACLSHLLSCLIAGRTAMGERVWDMQRLLDWARTLPDADGRNFLMMGNSGGGMVTAFTAACDQRISIAVQSCSFCSSVSANPSLEERTTLHCSCNMVPGLLEIGGLPGTAGLIAPRYFLAVSGRKDTGNPPQEVQRAASKVAEIFEASGYPQNFENRWGSAGHRYYKDLMWPFIMDALQDNPSK